LTFLDGRLLKEDINFGKRNGSAFTSPITFAPPPDHKSLAWTCGQVLHAEFPTFPFDLFVEFQSFLFGGLNLDDNLIFFSPIFDYLF
jgi:hypothetical protein